MTFQNAFFAGNVLMGVPEARWRSTGRIVHGLLIRQLACSATYAWRIVRSNVCP